MPKFHVKKGEVVVVLAGKEKGKRGKIIAVLRKQQRVIVEGAQEPGPSAGRDCRTRRHHPPFERDESGSI
jgi:ribosomal protein L14E/L6E/L27E